jgi:glycosyltransferase involved in cell wall biosynthesis
LQKKYGDRIDIYIEERPFFRPEWKNSKKLVYTTEYNKLINSFKKWNGEQIDLVYSITYQYDVTDVKVNGELIPTCVFYTSEFSWLDKSYFCYYQNDQKYGFASEEDLTTYFDMNKQMYFTSPSVWSSKGMMRFNVPEERNRIITHGVDTSIFKLNTDKTQRTHIRKLYKIKDDDILLINIGAMTQNKGIVLIIQALNELVHKHNKTKYKLLLKGTGDLYDSKLFLETYFEGLKRENILSQEEENNLLTNHIIFTNNTLSYERINDLFNAADLYISPYLAEGFNLTVLEALSAGLPVLVPETGSTKEYIEDIKTTNGNFIFNVKSKVIDTGMGMKQNSVNIRDVVDLLIKIEGDLNKIKNDKYKEYSNLQETIRNNYSWNTVADLLYNYFTYIVNRTAI